MPISPDELADLIDHHWGPLLAWIGGRDGLAEDVVQTAFIKLAAAQPIPEHPAGWLYRVSRRLAINERKSQRRRLRRQASAVDRSPHHSTVWQSAEANELIDSLDQMPADLREIVVARIWGQLSFEEIASMLGASRSTVWRRYGEAISLLRQRYGVPCRIQD